MKAFEQLLLSAMIDAVDGLKLSQVKLSVEREGKKTKFVRVIIVPEDMEFHFPGGLRDETKKPPTTQKPPGAH